LPTIAIEPIDFVLPDLSSFEWIVFTSTNGVGAMFDRGLAAAGLDTRALGNVKVAAIGPGTATALQQRGVRPDLVPERFVAESLLEAFPAGTGRVLLARAEVARDVLPEGLHALGYAVDVLAVYRTRAADPDPDALERVRKGDVDACTFTSSSTVENFCAAVGTLPEPQPLVVSIGPITSATARERGLRVDVEAENHTIDGVVEALVSALRR
jgi:uroporphyrinogen-III synthase